jgi:hypothetical protein
MMRIEKVFLVALWLLCCFLLWSPWPGGATTDGPRIGPSMRTAEYGFAGYYRVTDRDGHRTGKIKREGLVFSVVTTALMTLVCLRGYRQCCDGERHSCEAQGHEGSPHPRPPSQQVSTME